VMKLIEIVPLTRTADRRELPDVKRLAKVIVVIFISLFLVFCNL